MSLESVPPKMPTIPSMPCNRKFYMILAEVAPEISRCYRESQITNVTPMLQTLVLLTFLAIVYKKKTKHNFALR